MIEYNANYYWLSENHIIYGNTEGKYALVSPIQREKGKRWFYPHFGFAYKPINTNVQVVLVSDIDGMKSHTVLLDKSFNAQNTNWHYFFKNLNDVDFLFDTWTDSAKPELLWQIVLLFEVSPGGSISVDNIG